MVDPAQLPAQIAKAMRQDRHRFREQLRGLSRLAAEDSRLADRWARLVDQVARSVALHETRRRNVPCLRYDEQLPVCARRDEIAAAIAEHQVLIVCGETGSGKSTQLPKICLELGRGIEGLIGHTQPRRIAARSVAARIAEELQTPLGQAVGFKVRFSEALGPQTYIKLMTDGILLAELQGDSWLQQYDTLIIDEAHERSLNIDFLLGYLKTLLPRRRDLKLIITSATIDAARFSAHFDLGRGPAPIMEVAGRAWPVEVRWQPVQPDEDTGEIDTAQAVLDAVDQLAAEGPGDMLVFMPTERHIHETAKALRGRMAGTRRSGGTEILPLYARLSIPEQQKVFQPHAGRRIVIATNVAESSLTVPGIRYVIDPGTARISRYAPRSKTQRLPIEPVSRASADQRKGRCGRVGSGICVRLYSEEDYLSREQYTAPEIQRTNLAAVILQAKAYRLGEIESFPFLDPPRPEAIRDGYKTLFELGAIDEEQRLTEIGRQLSRLPVDPRIGRMILAAHEENCLAEVLIIAAALEVQEPRERPLEKQQAADECHAQFRVEGSDFLGYLKLWDFYHALRAKVSRSQLRKACRQNFLSFNRMREWLDVHRELLDLARQIKLAPGPRREDSNAIHRAVLTGLLANVAQRGETHEYSSAGGGKCQLWPGSAVIEAKPKWVVCSELVETSRRYLRTVARIDPRWIEPLAPHLVHRSYSDLQWDAESGSAVAFERVTLFGLPIVARRRVAYGPIDAAAARQLLIQHGLVEGRLARKPEVIQQNEQLLQELEQLQAKLRRNDLLQGPWARYEFYDRRLPEDVYDVHRLTRWLRQDRGQNAQGLRMTRADLLVPDAPGVAAEDFPDHLALPAMQLPLEYRFEPGSADDGVTLTVPAEALAQVEPRAVGWLVPGLLEQKVLALIRALPKHLRRQFVPANDTARRVAAAIRFGEGELTQAVARELSRLAGQAIDAAAFQEERLPDDLRMNFHVVDVEGNSLASGRDLVELRRQLGSQVAARLAQVDDPLWNRQGLTTWDFDELPTAVDVRHGRVLVKAYPGLLDERTSVALRLFDSADMAEQSTRAALRRLFCQACSRDLRTQVNWLPGLPQMLVYAAAVSGLDLKQELMELLADRAMLADLPPVRTRAQYDERLALGRTRIGLGTQDLAGLMGPLWEGFHRARLAWEQASLPRWQHAADDIHAQLARLVYPSFLTATPWDWLRHYPRYLQAVAGRVERLSGNLPRDREATEELAAMWESYQQRADDHRQRGIVDGELVCYRWMLEEYRVSLFAQKLGTAIPVSRVRLERQWAKIGL